MINIKAQKFSGAEAIPLLEGGKGISVSTGETCGAWAANDCVGTFSAVNADSYDLNNNVIPQIYHEKTRKERQQKLIEYAISGGITQAKIARERSNGKGRIHMNVLWEMGGCKEIIEGVLSGAKGYVHGVVCGAGMPYSLAEITSNFGVYYYPIVSSARAFSALYRRTFRKFSEFLGGIVYEDPWLAGGHNGLSNAEKPNAPINPYLRLVELRNVMNSFDLQNIPIIIAGGVWWLSEWEDYIDNKELGLVAFQFGTRPILTTETSISKSWHKKLMSLKKGDIKLTQLSPTGFYSSAINNNMLSSLLERQNRQIKIQESSSMKVKTFFGQEFCVDESEKINIDNWNKEGYSAALVTPCNTLVFVTNDDAKQITNEQKKCCGCLSVCRFSSWCQEKGSTGKIPDPRTFCIQNTLQNIAHGGNIEDNLMFAGHLAYRFAEDPFYLNGFIPTTAQLIERILSGF